MVGNSCSFAFQLVKFFISNPYTNFFKYPNVRLAKTIFVQTRSSGKRNPPTTVPEKGPRRKHSCPYLWLSHNDFRDCFNSINKLRECLIHHRWWLQLPETVCQVGSSLIRIKNVYPCQELLATGRKGKMFCVVFSLVIKLEFTTTHLSQNRGAWRGGDMDRG